MSFPAASTPTAARTVGIVAFNWNVLLPMLVTGDLGGTAGSYGLVMGVMSVGSLSGSLWLARGSKRVGFVRGASDPNPQLLDAMTGVWPSG